jgi:hypothetical protein
MYRKKSYILKKTGILLIIKKVNEVGRSKFKMCSAQCSFCLWSQNGQSTIVGNLLYVDIWACRIFYSKYILFVIYVNILEYLLRDYNIADLVGR